MQNGMATDYSISRLRVYYRDETWLISGASPDESLAIKELLPQVYNYSATDCSFSWPAADFTPATVDLGDTKEFVNWLRASERWPTGA